MNKGDFVKVGNDVGVVVFLEGENEVPDEHLGIWYGETNKEEVQNLEPYQPNIVRKLTLQKNIIK